MLLLNKYSVPDKKTAKPLLKDLLYITKVQFHVAKKTHLNSGQHLFCITVYGRFSVV